MNHVVNHLNVSKATFEAELPQGDPSEWNCDQVYQFVKLVAGVAVAELFLAQEVDGSALSLIRDDHLVNTMGIKLGPALKIMNKFNEVKNRF
jgi:polyhomeotic-like protein 1